MSTFIVTGASSGIGRATAEALAHRGASVIAVARSSDALAELAGSHPHVRPVVADLSTDHGIEALVEAAALFERLASVVHSAGSLVPVEGYADLSPVDLTRHFRIHVATPIEINNRLHGHLSGGRIIYIDSYSAASPRVGWSGYSIVKAAAQMAARAAAEELDDVDVVRIFPGGVRTPLVEAVLDAPGSSPAAEAFRHYDQAGDIADPADVGEYIATIAHDVDRSTLSTTEFWDYNQSD